MDNEYSKMLYREGSELEWHGHSLDCLVVDDAEAEAEAKKDGWHEIKDILKPKKAAAK